MSGKSRRGKGKSPMSSKKKRNIRRSQQVVAQLSQPQAEKPAATPAPPTPVATAAEPVAVEEPVAVAVTASYHNLPFELRRICILAAVMLVVLVVLVLVLG